ncbi:hypothetical protein GEMRC1_009848 [Eukaryota sp. GEM-RC1]
MFVTEPPLKTSRSPNGTLSTDLANDSSSVSNSQSSLDLTTFLSGDSHSVSKHIRLQQSLLILIDFHLLKRVMKSSKTANLRPSQRLAKWLSSPYSHSQNVALVSQHFLNSLLSAFRVFLQTTILPITREDLPRLASINAYFQTQVKYVSLHVHRSFDVLDLLEFTPIISNLSVNDLTHLHQLLDPSSSFIIAALANNSVIQTVDFSELRIHTPSVLEPLMSSSSIKSIVFPHNFDFDSSVINSINENSAITTVCLKKTECTSPSVYSSIANLIKFDNSLKKMVLDVCKCYLPSIFESLGTNTSLLELILHSYGCGCKIEGLRNEQSLFRMIQRNTSLLVLSLGGSIFDSFLLSAAMRALKSRSSSLKIVCLSDLQFKSVVLSYNILSASNSIMSRIQLHPHYFDVLHGFLHFDNTINNCDLVHILEALKSNVRFERITCQGLRSPSMNGIITLFKILSIKRTVIELDISPSLLDIESRVFCYSPTNFVSLTRNNITSLQRFVNRFAIKVLTIKNCCFDDQSIDALSGLIRTNNSLTSINFRFPILSNTDFALLFGAILYNSSLRKVVVNSCSSKSHNLWTIVECECCNMSLPTKISVNQSNEFGCLVRTFGQLLARKSIDIIEMFDHSINVGCGYIRFSNTINCTDLAVLLEALNSGVPIKRVDCLGLRTSSLEEIITFFLIRSINSTMLGYDISPNRLDIESGAFCYSPERQTRITSKDVSRLQQSFLSFKFFRSKELTLKRCAFLGETFDALCHFINANNSLTSVNFSECIPCDDSSYTSHHQTGTSFTKFISKLHYNSNLKKVVLKDCNIGLCILLTILELNSSGNETQKFNVSPHSIDFKNGSFCFSPEHLTKITINQISSLNYFIQSSGFKNLTLRGCRFTETTINVLCDLLNLNNSLTSVDFSHCDLSDQAFSQLISALKLNSSSKLSRICMIRNSIGSGGAFALSELLKGNTVIKEIYIFGNTIDDDGVIALAEALSVNSTLTRIDLGDNHVGSAGAVALASALKRNISIEDVCLHANSIENEGAIALAETLLENSSVTNIDLGFNSIDTGTEQFVERNSKGRIKF